MKKLSSVCLLMILASCAQVQSVSQTSIPRDRRNVVTAKVEKNIIFLMNFDNDYLDELTTKLKSQCQNGAVRGILTKDENITYFPIIFHKSVVTATGYCVGEKNGKAKRSRKRRS